MLLQILREPPEARRDLSEGDPERHGARIAASELRERESSRNPCDGANSRC
jgi:hypothetical protein